MKAKIKIFVHTISNGGRSHRDKEGDWITPIWTRVNIYTNDPELDLSDIKYNNAITSIKYGIYGREQFDVILDDWWIAIRDESGRESKELADVSFAHNICDLLNNSIGKDLFEVFELKPYKILKLYNYNWIPVDSLKDVKSYEYKYCLLYYAPQESECCYEISSMFRNAITMDDINRICNGTLYKHNYRVRFDEFSETDFYRNYRKDYGADDLILKLERLEEEELKIRAELKKMHLVENRIRIKRFCNAFRYLFTWKNNWRWNKDWNTPRTLMYSLLPDDFIPISSLLKAGCNFILDNNETVQFGQFKNVIYPLNIAYELESQSFFCDLINRRYFKFSCGHFADLEEDNNSLIKNNGDKNSIGIIYKKHNIKNMLNFARAIQIDASRVQNPSAIYPEDYLTRQEIFNRFRSMLQKASVWNDILEDDFPEL